MSPLLETKLRAPGRTDTLIDRSRLREHLDRRGRAPLTLVSAPAGFGKTTAITEWLGSSAMERSVVAWVSLDERDNDPVTYWS